MADILKIAISHAWKVDNNSVQMIYHWSWRFIGFPKIRSSSMSMVGFTRNMQKC